MFSINVPRRCSKSKQTGSLVDARRRADGDSQLVGARKCSNHRMSGVWMLKASLVRTIAVCFAIHPRNPGLSNGLWNRKSARGLVYWPGASGSPGDRFQVGTYISGKAWAEYAWRELQDRRYKVGKGSCEAYMDWKKMHFRELCGIISMSLKKMMKAWATRKTFP